MIDQHSLAVIRSQGDALAKLRKGSHKAKVNILAADAIALIGVAMHHPRFENGSDAALKNTWITLAEKCESKIEQCAQGQKARGDTIDFGGCLQSFSFHDFGTLVDSAQQVATAIDPTLNHGAGSGVAGDGERELQVEPVRATSFVDADGVLRVEQVRDGNADANASKAG